ncbi:unnamed protein product [Paramecium sonneborni]|uniref:Uncharacterized protein n=1 Tax=Paramecium sonneborni TaxID=65129 RepID=A0A8S1NHZ1_9CILI|nr:unnamed protein product [Paramecium sonneborni]
MKSQKNCWINLKNQNNKTILIRMGTQRKKMSNNKKGNIIGSFNQKQGDQISSKYDLRYKKDYIVEYKHLKQIICSWRVKKKNQTPQHLIMWVRIFQLKK